MNWVLMPARGCLDLTQQALKSLLEQTVDVKVWIMNQGSKDETPVWLNSLKDERVIWTHHYPQFKALSAAWNYALSFLFKETDHVLVVNNDTVFRPDTYEKLLEHQVGKNRGFVTAVSMDDREKVIGGVVNEDRTGERPHPDFSCFLISRSIFWKVGPFDLHFIPAFREDQDYHWRMQQVGIEAVCIDVPFYHRASATVKNNPEDALNVAKWDRFRMAYYIEKWGGLWGHEIYKKPFDGRRHTCPVCGPPQNPLEDYINLWLKDGLGPIEPWDVL